MSDAIDTPRASALFLSAFFDELIACGVHEVVVSPGSRSTPLAMVAHASDMELFVDVDERGAAFFALGLAKASGRPACLICTSGTAVANYYPAILEAESSRVPLIVLTGDRPPHLQGLGAPQTCDQVKVYGDHVRYFRQMPLPAATPHDIAFARQMAKAACIHAEGGEASGPVHFNFPFDEPLKPDLSVAGLFEVGRGPVTATLRSTDADARDVQDEKMKAHAGAGSLAPLMTAATRLAKEDADALMGYLADRRTIVLVGEGSFSDEEAARELIAWARTHALPLLADPLSGLRSFTDPLVIDNYDNMFGKDDCPPFDTVVRFGRYPVSKRCFANVCSARPVQIVVDTFDTRDFNAATDVFVRCSPTDFVRATADAGPRVPRAGQETCAQQWIARNDEERHRIAAVADDTSGFEGAYVAKLFELIPARSLMFAANSMSIRATDTFYLKADKSLTVLCNRGLNGIDGTISTALGASRHFDQTTLLTGDLTLLHDINALALQEELIGWHGGDDAPSIVIVVLNNRGGAIFDMLPQKSDEAYFERLFLTPQHVDFEHAARAFGVPYRFSGSVEAFAEAYRSSLGVPGISMIEVSVPLEGLTQRYGRYT